MNTVIVDSGATKAEWVVCNSAGDIIQSFVTAGISPFYLSQKEIEILLHQEVTLNISTNEVERLFYYGTGCSQEDKIKIIENALQSLFQKTKIAVAHDLIASARATCLHQAGIACILGTGSNSCVFDGATIIDQIPSLGFLLGDEGSGAWMGKSILTSFYYREMPKDLELLFQQFFPKSREEILNEIYDSTTPNQVVASYMTFVKENIRHEFVRKMAKQSFQLFIKRMIMKYQNHLHLPVHFIGSIAFFQQEILQEVLQEFSLKPGRIIRSPMEGLINFHCKTKN